MCSNERAVVPAGAAAAGPGPGPLPYPLAALKQLNEASAGSGGGGPAAAGSAAAAAPAAPAAPLAPASLLPLDHYRLQLYNYAMAERLRFSQTLSQAQHYPAPLPLYPGYPPYGPRLAFSMSLFHHRALQPEEPKPQHSYIGLIAMAILSSPDHKLVLSDIYQYILDNYPYFRTRGPGWRNSIRHNLSLNDCFIKAGRSANGKGHYWAIHPANIEDFKKGDFRRRKAQRKVRKHMGLAVDEEGNDSPSPPPAPGSPPAAPVPLPPVPGLCWAAAAAAAASAPASAVFPSLPCAAVARKRQFDVASLLAPDDEDELAAAAARKAARRPQLSLPPPPLPPPPPPPPPQHPPGYASSGEDEAADEDIDVVTSDQDGEAARDRRPEDGGSEAEPGPGLERDGGSPQLAPAPGPGAGWGPSSGPGQGFQQHPAAFMFPAPGLEQHLVSRYYEHLAQQRRAPQPQQQQGNGCRLSPPAPGAEPAAPES